MAACRGMDVNLFYPERWARPQIPLEAVAACERCPVRQDCLDYATEHELHGYWGGLSSSKRRDRRRDQAVGLATPMPKRVPPHGTANRYQWDRRHGAEPCVLCRGAWSRAVVERKRRAREVTE